MSQVISAIDFIDSKINDGEWPTPSVLNRPLLSTIDALSRLEESVQYAARSMDMIVTENTKFLSHFDGLGIDSVGTVSPMLTTSAGDAFVFDGIFKGSAFTQPPITNVLSTATGVDTTITTLNGWNTNVNSGVSLTVGSHGATLSNTKYSTVSIGESFISSATFTVTPGTVLSYSVEVDTDTNLAYKGIRVGTELIYLDSAGLRVYPTSTTVNTTNKVKGLVTIENSVVPATAVSSYVTCYMWCDTTTSIGSITFKNAMVSLSPVAQVHCVGTRVATRISYPRVITNSKVGTIVCWAKFKSIWLQKHVGPIGPVFVSNSSGTLTLGAVHDSADGVRLKLKLRMMVDGAATYGNDIILDSSNLDTYVPCALRFSEYTDAGVVNMKIEFAIVDGGLTVHKSTIDLPTFTIPTPLDIRVGGDNMTTDFFNCPVSEVRYDEEWLNDYELTVIALAKRAFLTQNELDINSIFSKTVAYLDGTKPNLIRNPDGRLNTYHWNTHNDTTYIGPAKVNPQGLGVTVFDQDLGSCFTWAGTAANNIRYNSHSLSITVEPGDKLIFRAKMYASSSTTGTMGIAIGFYDGSGDGGAGNCVYTLGPKCAVIPGAECKYYDVPVTIPAGTAYVVAVMYVDKGSTSSRMAWGKLKMERGETATQWIDDTTPKYAVYAN